MSRAFVKDPDGVEQLDELPERLISPHRNLVTAEGQAAIEAEVQRLQTAYGDAQKSHSREELNAVVRDLKYWTARRQSAELVPPAADKSEVHFGATVTLKREDGRKQTFRIVGEDEANPSKGSIAYVAPLAHALMGKAVGDDVKVGGHTFEIVKIG